MNEKQCAGCGECKCGETSERVKAVRLVEIDYDRRLAGQTAEEAAWFEAEVLSDRGLLLLHSNNIGATVGKVRVLSAPPADADRADPCDAVARVARYIKMREMKPGNLQGNIIHCIHSGTEYEAELTISDLRLMLDMLRRLAAAPAVPATHTTFSLGESVRKTKGSQWRGRVVGWYSTTLTPEGYAVESATERGSVQIYPAAALERDAAPAVPERKPLTDEQIQQCAWGFFEDSNNLPDWAEPFVRAVEAAHGIAAAPAPEGGAA